MWRSEEYHPGQIAINQLAFSDGRCEVISTFVHEVAHSSTGIVHSGERGIDYQYDWLNLLGDIAGDVWREENGESCY